MRNTQEGHAGIFEPLAQLGRAAVALGAFLFTSLDKALTVPEAQELVRKKARFADYDIRLGGNPAAVRLLRDAGVCVFTYDIGDGGGSAWREPSGLLNGAAGEKRVYDATQYALLHDCNGIHLDNTHALSSERLEKLMDVQVKAARDLERAGKIPPGVFALHVKNAASNYADVLQRRPDLRALTKMAAIEHIETHASGAKRLAEMGIPVYGIEFRHSTFGSPTRSLEQTKAFVQRSPWITGVYSMPDERNYEGRTATFIEGAAGRTNMPSAASPWVVNKAPQPSSGPDIKQQDGGQSWWQKPRTARPDSTPNKVA